MRSPTTTSCARCSRRLSEGASVRIGSGDAAVHADDGARRAAAEAARAGARCATAADGSNLSFVIGEHLFLKAYRRLRARRASGMGDWPLSHGALAVRRRRADGRRNRARAAVGRADDDRPRASGRTEPGRRLALHAALPRAQHRRRRGTRDRTARSARADHSSYLLLVRALAARTAELHRALAVPTGDPSFDPEPFTARTLRRMGGRTIRSELDATLSDAARTARRASRPTRATRGGCARDATDRLHAAIEKRAAGPTTASRDSPARRLSTWAKCS